MIEWVNKPPLPEDETGGKEEDCKCNSKQKDKCCCHSEPRQIVRCQCSSYRDRRLKQHRCECESPQEEEDNCCPCSNRKSSCDCCKCDDDEIPEKETPKGESKETNTRYDESYDDFRAGSPASSSLQRTEDTPQGQVIRDGNLQTNSSAREENKTGRGGGAASRIENQPAAREENRMLPGGVGMPEGVEEANRTGRGGGGASRVGNQPSVREEDRMNRGGGVRPESTREGNRAGRGGGGAGRNENLKNAHNS